MSLKITSAFQRFWVGSKWRNSGLIVAILVIVILVLLFLNPWDILTKKSSFFSNERFDEIEIGDSISLAIKTLGQPLSITKCSDDKPYEVYLFMGEYPDWVIGGTECWLLIDQNGLVFEKRRYIE